MMKTNKNITWIDTAKAICMILIFYAHTKSYWSFNFNDGTFYGAIYVNTFFFISGYLLFRKHLSAPIALMNKEEYKPTSKAQFKSILFKMIVPSIIFAIVEFVPSALIKGNTITPMFFISKTFGGGTYWFVSALVVAEVILCLLYLSRRKSVWFYFLIASVLAAVGVFLIKSDFKIVQGYDSFPWMYKQGLSCLIFLVTGGVYSKYESTIRKVTDKIYIILIMGILYFGLLTIIPSAFESQIIKGINIQGYLISVLGIILLISVCQKIPETKVMKFIGKNTLGYYFLCGAVPITETKLLSKIIPTGTFIGWIVLLVSSFVITGLLVYLIKKFIPFVFDLRIIKRKDKQKTVEKKT